MTSPSEDRRTLVESLAALAESEFADRAFEWRGETPWANVERLAEEDYLGIALPAEYGGGGRTEFEALLAVEAVGRVCPDTAQVLYEQGLVGPRAVEMFGSEAVKERYLPRVTAGETFLAVAISEPGAGSDVGAMETRVTESDGGLVLDGQKLWVSHAEEAAAAVVWVKFPDGLGTVLVDLDAEGVETGRQFTNMAGHAQSQLFFEGVPIPGENVLTRGRAAFERQLRALNWERLGSSALANALSRCALERVTDAGGRDRSGRPGGRSQGIEWKLADAVTELSASRALTCAAASAAIERGEPPDRFRTSLAKLYSAEAVERIVSEALQVVGAAGYRRGHPLEYLYRMARARRIAAGTDEMQKNGIADALKRDGVPSVV